MGIEALATSLLVVLLVVEAVLLGSWIPWYYPRGLRGFTRVFERLSHTQLTTVPELALEARFSGGVLVPDFVFRRISDREVGFQERAASFRVWSYIPVMRGLISYQPERARIVVAGILQWYAIVAPLVVLACAWGEGLAEAATVGVVSAIAIAGLWGLQSARFHDVAAALDEIINRAA
jgi:hypothetical protein